MTDKMQIYNKAREVPKEAKKSINAGRLKGMTDINPMWRIKKLTELFGACGIGWYYEVTEKSLHSMNNGSEVVATVDINLYIKNGDEWSKPIVGTGGSKMQTQERNGAYVNDEAFKMALTDAISVACKALGMGADVYWQSDNTKYNDNKKDYAQEERQAAESMKDKVTKNEAKTISDLCDKFGANKDDVLKYAGVKKFEDMTKTQYVQIFQMLEQKYGSKEKSTIGTK